MDDVFRELAREGVRKKWDMKELQKNLLELELHIEVEKQQEQIRNRRTLDPAPAPGENKNNSSPTTQVPTRNPSPSPPSKSKRTSQYHFSTGKYFQIRIKKISRNRKPGISVKRGSKRIKKG